MKESISYSFLLNIVILFIFVCFAIIMGILSYYKAFRANTIISNTIEKYEGYNCLSKVEIGRKLSGIAYAPPFKVNCNGKGNNCTANEANGYVVTSYNLDIPEKGENMIDVRKFGNQEEDYISRMNSTYTCNENGCTTNKNYQYGIYTYMYVELPVISGILKIPFFSKTSVMYEFRDFYVDTDKKSYIDANSVFDEYYDKTKIDGKTYIKEKTINGLTSKQNIYYLYEEISENIGNNQILVNIDSNKQVDIFNGNYRTRGIMYYLEYLRDRNAGQSEDKFSTTGRCISNYEYAFDYAQLSKR